MNQRAPLLGLITLLAPCVALAGACTTTVQGGGTGGTGASGGFGGSPWTTSTVNTTVGVTSTGTVTPGTTTTTTTTTVATTTTTTSTGTMGGPTTTTTVSTGTGMPGCQPSTPLSGPCAPKAVCGAGTSVCLSHVNQAGSTTLSYRMSEVDFTKPAAFTTGVVSSVLQSGVLPQDQACNLNGTATFSWLLRFDTTAGTLETGGARPVASPSGPYTFDNEMLQIGTSTYHVQPATLMAGLSTSCAFDSTAGDVIIPVFLDAQGTQVVLLPLHALRFSNGSVSPDLGCIGRYDAENLDPANSCLSDATHKTFTDGASFDAYISLEEADAVVISQLGESLCVLLSGNAAMYGNGAQPVSRCKRDAQNHIVYQGDWCAATNAAASGGCADAVAMAANFAAQAVHIQ